MHHFVNCTFTSPSGGSFAVNNIQHIRWGVDRGTALNGHVGTMGHNIHNVTFQRIRSLQVDNVAQLEGEIIDLAAAREKKAYFSAEITIARADDANDIIKTIRWTNGHICRLENSVDLDEIIEEFEVSVTDLEVNDSVFKRNVTT